jgi:Flp pilus assembly protein TadG
MIFGLLVIPLFFSAGMAVDYSIASRVKDQLNSAADTAALSAVTPGMMAQSSTQATTVATNMFNGQLSTVRGVNAKAVSVTVNVTDSGLTRTAQVSYTASVQNAFAGVYGQYTTSLKGGSTASATSAPNIDFYMLLDSSPSMAIAATTAGINTMVAATSAQGGCAFACHQYNTATDGLGNPGGEDNYALARNLGVTLRMDNVQSAVKNLTSTAQLTMGQNNAAYRIAIYTFDANFNTIQTLSSNLSAVQSAASNIVLLEVYKNNWLTSTNNNSDADTNYDNAMSQVNAIMPNPGGGTNTFGDTSQEVLFLVTDGVEDEMVSGKRQQSLMSNSWCTTIKKRGIRIAVLYTTYLPLPTNSWYNTYIAPFQAQIGPNMQSCASPGLYFEVKTDGDITAAMNALFRLAVSTAHLTK